jgi:hypothetical protein
MLPSIIVPHSSLSLYASPKRIPPCSTMRSGLFLVVVVVVVVASGGLLDCGGERERGGGGDAKTPTGWHGSIPTRPCGRRES